MDDKYKKLYEKNGVVISTQSSKYTKDENNINRFGIMYTSQVPFCGVRFDNGRVYRKKESELNLSFGYFTLLISWYK
jgi:hypothetical protein